MLNLIFVLPFVWTGGTRATLSVCSAYQSCNQCIRTSGCGWCSSADLDSGWCTSIGGGAGNSTCNISQYDGPKKLTISDSVIPLYELSCPFENECENGQHDCDLAVARCVDSEVGFECQCVDGYEKKNSACVPTCTRGCINGDCVRPNVCQCHFGFVGSSCQSACNCSGHSTCAVQDLSTCIKCYNHTHGAHCEFCDAGYIQKGSSCFSCSEYCHNHSETCLGDIVNGLMHSLSLGTSIKKEIGNTDVEMVLPNASSLPPLCFNCTGFTKGLQCEYCLPGYFRPPSATPFESCIRCDCNGHSIDNVCNPQRGDGCDCQNNTVSPRNCRDDECWLMQCIACKDNFRGFPVNGHQCYRDLLDADDDRCLAPDQCPKFGVFSKMRPLDLSFFVVTPEFTNVDLRILLDVSEGIVDVFLAMSDIFLARYDATANCNILEWRLTGIYTHSERNPFVGGLGDEGDACAPGVGSSWESVIIRDVGKQLACYVTYASPSPLLILRNVRNRITIVVPSTVFDSKPSRFYLVIRANGSSNAGVFGNLLYTQDQAHFDLFIFFAVLFAAFFLAVSVALASWRFKMWYLDRQHDQDQIMELMKLAKRPFAKASLVWEDDERFVLDSVQPWPICVQTLRKKAAIVATTLVKMPGGSEAPVKISAATALLLPLPVIKDKSFDQQAGNLDTMAKKKARRLAIIGRYRVHPF